MLTVEKNSILFEILRKLFDNLFAPTSNPMPTKPNVMPAIRRPKAPTNYRPHKKARPLISAAVSMPPDLYTAALEVAAEAYDNNFSRYMRTLILNDLPKS